MKFTYEQLPETESHKRTRNQARTRQRAERRIAPVKFTCIDGEGMTVGGEHRYVLLGLGDEYIADPGGLHWKEVFEFLYGHFESGGTAYCGFFLGYDFTQWVKTLPEYKAARLLTIDGRAARLRRTGHNGQPLEGQVYFPVDLDGWEVDMLGAKRMKIRPAGQSRWMYICDSGGFFQKSFLKVIDPAEWTKPVCSPGEYNLVKAGKERRSDAVLDENMIYYNQKENELLGRVLHELDTGLRELGVHLSPKQWFGPGQAAQEWLKGRAPLHKDMRAVTPEGAYQAACQSYYGGWFEIMAHGHIPGTTWEYDVNSAYPWIISRLPCLMHGTWDDGARWDIPAPDKNNRNLMLVRASVFGNSRHVGAMLHRDKDGSIYRPQHTDGWYWAHELSAAIRAGIVDHWDITQWHRYTPCDCPAPFREIQDIYDMRLKVGKKTPLGIACKLIPNSLYGKFAQSVGSPKYANMIYASLITAGCRTMILDAIGTHPGGVSDVLMVATDGVYFRSPHPSLEMGGKLGQWDQSARANMLLFKPGVYWDDLTREAIMRNEAPVFKARGISARDFAASLARVDDQFTALGCKVPDVWPAVKFPVSFSMVTALQALQRHDWASAGTVRTDKTMVQDSDPVGKRMQPWWQDGLLRTRSRKNYPYAPSVPYKKAFGYEDPWSDESIAEQGISPDGEIGSLISEVLGER